MNRNAASAATPVERFVMPFIKRVDSHREGSKWGNVFLTGSWTLYVDFVQEQHDVAMKRLGIVSQDVIASGCLRTTGGIFDPDPYGISFRSSPAFDRGEISDDKLSELYKAIKKIVLPFEA